MQASIISKIEKQDRRVDVDDLVALAVALDVTPNRLLLPPEADGEVISLTPSVQARARYAWAWATGERPLIRGTASPVDTQLQPGEVASFSQMNRPHAPLRPAYLQEWQINKEALKPLMKAISDALRNGVPAHLVREAASLTLQNPTAKDEWMFLGGE